MKEKSIFQEAGLKKTASREIILDIIKKNASPMSARDILEKVLLQKSSIGFATVYRVLSTLCDFELARKIPSEGQILYESTQTEAVPQIVCSRCGKMEEVNDPAVIAYNEAMLKSRGLAESDPLLIYASCKRKECIDN